MELKALARALLDVHHGNVSNAIGNLRPENVLRLQRRDAITSHLHRVGFLYNDEGRIFARAIFEDPRPRTEGDKDYATDSSHVILEEST